MRKNIKTYETIEKDEILYFQSLGSQLLDIKQLRKTGGHESLLPSHSYFASFLREIRHFPTSRQTEILRQLVAILVILYDISVTWGEVYYLVQLTSYYLL